MDLRELKLMLAEIVQVAGTIFLVIALAALPFLVAGVGLNPELLGLLAIISVPVVGGASLAAILVCGAYLACLPFRRLRTPAPKPVGGPGAGGIWDPDLDGWRGPGGA